MGSTREGVRRAPPSPGSLRPRDRGRGGGEEGRQLITLTRTLALPKAEFFPPFCSICLSTVHHSPRILDIGHFDFGHFNFGQLAEVEIGRSRTHGVCSFSDFSCFFFFFFLFLFLFLFLLLFLVLPLLHLHFLLLVLSLLHLRFSFVVPKHLNPEA